MKFRVSLAVTLVVLATAIVTCFIPLKSKSLPCASQSSRYSFLLGQSEEYEKAEGHTPGSNEGICLVPPKVKATLYVL